MTPNNTIDTDHHVDEKIDITGFVCPMTFVRTKLKLEQMAAGEVLLVRLKCGEPLENVPRSARQHGHEVISIEPEKSSAAGQTDIYHVIIKKNPV